jgi:hypothetical protein
VNVGDLVDYCLSKPGAEETYPWGEQDLVAKVGGKAFAFIGLESGGVSLKCGTDAQDAGEWRGRYPDAITVSAYTGKTRLEFGPLGRRGSRRGDPRARGLFLRGDRREAAEVEAAEVIKARLNARPARAVHSPNLRESSRVRETCL